MGPVGTRIRGKSLRKGRKFTICRKVCLGGSFRVMKHLRQQCCWRLVLSTNSHSQRVQISWGHLSEPAKEHTGFWSDIFSYCESSETPHSSNSRVTA